MSKPITVKELFTNCRQLIKEWHWDKYVFLIDDDEWNWVHACRYSINPVVDCEDYQKDCERNLCDPKDCVVLW